MRAALPRALVLALAVAAAVYAVAPRLAVFAERAGAATYLVQSGDSLSEIADRFDTTVAELVRLNGLADPDHLVTGTTLQIRVATRSGMASTTGYRVQEGDTLSAIASAHGLSTTALAQLNQLENPNFLRLGTELLIPSVGAAASTSSGTRTHTVATGETLSSIAAEYGTSVAAIVVANSLSNGNVIRTGQTLTIPAAALPELSVRAASALEHAAKASGVDRDLLMALSLMESGWQSHVVSHTGAVGLMQLMPDTAEWAVTHLSPDADNWHGSIEDNAIVGAEYFAHLLFLEGGDVEGALASYYQGWSSYKTDGMYEETRDYVDDVMALVERLRRQR